MNDKKLTDNEIVKALEESISFDELYDSNFTLIRIEYIKSALDLFNRQKAENERLLQKFQRPQDVDPMDFCGVLCDFAEGLIETAKAKAYKEFAERLKENSIATFSWKGFVLVDEIDNLLKELVGEENAEKKE